MSILSDNVDRFCTEIPLGDPETCGVTLNQALAGTANPRTLVKPTIVAPITQLDYWRTNPTVTYSRLNTKTTKYPKLAGWSESDIFAIPLQPNIYTETDVYQPINATNGIAIVPQFPNTTILFETPTNDIYYDTNTKANYITVNETPELIENYTSMGPSCGTNKGCEGVDVRPIVIDTEPNNNSVYDPRLSGYGSDNRTYLDEQLGQNRYFYDDIDAIRMPQYLTRSKLDSCLTPYGDTYGEVNAGNLDLLSTRVAAEQSWVDNSLAFRNSMMKSLMRKRNEEQVQKRMAPKNTYGSRRTYAY